jgi:apolipoprotein N-acyltransferase
LERLKLKKSQYIGGFILIAISFLIGFTGLTSAPRFAVMILAVPVLWTLAGSRYSAFAVMLAYNLAASRGLPPGAAVFLSENHTPMQAAALYFLLSIGASLPFLIFWSGDKKRKAVCLIFAFLTAYAIPPVSLIGIVNPLMATGTILKGSGLAGMLAMLAIYALCAVSRKTVLIFLCVIAMFTVLPNDAWYEALSPEGFTAIDTSFGRLGSGSFSFSEDYERIKMVFADLKRRNLRESGASCVVLPETIAGRLNVSGLELWWEETRRVLRDDMAVIFGAELPAGDGLKYDNAAVMLYKGEITVSHQRIPVPYSMYRGPFAETGARLHLFGDGIISLPDGRKATIIICYESYLTWPYLVSMIRRPNMIISIANLWWCRDTSLPAAQRAVVSLWALTFGVPVIFAQNI